MGKYFRTVQEIKRVDPNYKYIVTIVTAPGLLGGFNVEIQGFSLDTEQKDDNENFISEWFWQRPTRDKLFELVDRLHVSVRSAMGEKDWDKIAEERIAKEMEQMRERMRREFESELERKIKEEAQKIQDEIDKNKPEV